MTASSPTVLLAEVGNPYKLREGITYNPETNAIRLAAGNYTQEDLRHFIQAGAILRGVPSGRKTTIKQGANKNDR